MPLIPRTAAAATAFVAALVAAPITCHASAQPPVEDVPFIVSPDNVTLEMLRIAGVKAGDHVIDLGSGDGRIVVLAAQRFGATGLGVEIDPELVRKSIASAREAGVAERTSFRVEDLFTTDLSRADVVTMYLLPEFNLRLRPSLLALRPGTRIVSHDWDMGDWQPDLTTRVDVPEKQVGREKSSRIHLWVVPARVQGVWCGRDAMQGATLRVSQRYQRFDATIEQATALLRFSGGIRGAVLQAEPSGPAPALRVEADRMEVLPHGSQAFERSRNGLCDTGSLPATNSGR